MPTKTCAPSANSTCRRGRDVGPGASRSSSSAPLSRQRLRERARSSARQSPDSSLPSLVSAVSRRSCRTGLRPPGTRSGGSARSASISATSGATRSGRPLVCAGSNSACGPLPTNSERMKIGAAPSSAWTSATGRNARAGDHEAAAGRRVEVERRPGGLGDAQRGRRRLPARSRRGNGRRARIVAGGSIVRRLARPSPDQVRPVGREIGERVAHVTGEAGHRLGGEQRVDDRLLGGFGRGLEQRLEARSRPARARRAPAAAARAAPCRRSRTRARCRRCRGRSTSPVRPMPAPRASRCAAAGDGRAARRSRARR